MDVTLRHDASRIVQSIIQFGTPVQKFTIVQSLCANKKCADICKTPYGHFTILKTLQYCKELEPLQLLVNAMCNHYLSIGCNSIGARVIESIYDCEHIPRTLKYKLSAEFYGKKYTVFLPDDTPPSSLVTVLKYTPTSKYFHVLDHMSDIIRRFVQKGECSVV